MLIIGISSYQAPLCSIPRTPTMIEKDLLVNRECLALSGSLHNSLDLLPCPLLWPVSTAQDKRVAVKPLENCLKEGFLNQIRFRRRWVE